MKDTDITEDLRKGKERLSETENALRESMERCQTLTDTAADAIICLKPPDTIYLWNKKAEDMFGYSAEEAFGRSLHQLIVPQVYRDKAAGGLKEFYQTGKGTVVGKTLELTALRKDGAEFPVELSVSVMNIRGEWHATGIIRDITERKRLENELKDKLDEIERLNKLMIGREIRMGEMKEEVRALKQRIRELESGTASQ